MKEKMKWGLFEMSGGDIHGAPLNDIRPHDLTRECECNPTIDEGKNGDRTVVMHHAWDFREVKEGMADGSLMGEITG